MDTPLVNALKAGVDSYIKKDCDLGEVEDAIRETSKAGHFFAAKFWIGFASESIDVNDLDNLPFLMRPHSFERQGDRGSFLDCRGAHQRGGG